LPTAFAARIPRAGLIRATTVLAVGTLLLGALAPTVSADEGLEVTTPYPAVAVAPGSKVSFDLTVTSTRNANVALSLSGVPTGWTATLHGGGFVVDGVAAGPGTDGTVRLDVSVPGETAASSQTLQVTASGGGAQDVLPISIRVNADAAGDISMDTNTPTLSGASNDTFPFALTLRNDTAQDITVSATAAVTDHPDWEVTAQIAGQEQAASTVVEAGSTTSINVTATPPANAPAGQYAVHVDVKAGEQTLTGDFGVEITGSYSMTLTTPEQVLSGSGGAGAAKSQQFVVTNTGTAPLENVALEYTAPTDWNVTFDPPTIAPIAPEDFVVVTAQITPSSQAVTGDYNVTITASNDQADAEALYRFTVETSPLWVVVSLGLIAAILLGLVYVFRTYGRR
jgi:uncharacterized membrane protein